MQVAGPGLCSSSRSWPRPGRRSGRSACTPRSWGDRWQRADPVAGVRARRLAIELPFVAFAVFLPFIGQRPAHRGARVVAVGARAVGGVEHPGQGHPRRRGHRSCWWRPPVRDLLRGLDRLHVPRVFTAITGFMIRYLEVIAGELGACAWPAIPRLRPPVALAGAACRGGRPARCSSARTSAANGCTWRWCHAATTAPCRGARRAPAPATGPPPCRSWRGRPGGGIAWRRGPRRRAGARDPRSRLRVPRRHQALFGVDLAIAAGERVALLGPNGAGKTTLVLHLNGILDGAGGCGAASAACRSRSAHLAEIRRRSASCSRTPTTSCSCPPSATTSRSGRRTWARGDDLDGPGREALAAVGMEDFADRPPHHLSFGQRRRVALATVLAMEPESWCSTSRRQPRSAGRRELAEIVRVPDVTMLIVTHDLPTHWSCARAPW